MNYHTTTLEMGDCGENRVRVEFEVDQPRILIIEMILLDWPGQPVVPQACVFPEVLSLIEEDIRVGLDHCGPDLDEDLEDLG